MSETYADLSNLVRSNGLLERQYAYYVIKFIITFALFGASIAFLLLVNNFYLQILNAVFFAFVMGQIATLFHDSAHQAVFKSKKWNDLSAIITGNTFLLISADAWNVRHNAHHSAPNHEDVDGDIEVPMLAYSEDQAAKKKGLVKQITKYQAFFWFFILTLSTVSMRFHMTKKIFPKLITKNWKYHFMELIFSIIGFAFYFGVIFYALTWWQAIIFITINNMATGLYLGTIFATNHKGMPIIKDGEKLDFLHAQVVTTRNVKGHPVTDLWMGGLNYQIEHHLFPTMPRCNLGKASILIRQFCAKNDLPYYETGFFRSYKEILQYFHEVSARLRNPKQTSEAQASN